MSSWERNDDVKGDWFCISLHNSDLSSSKDVFDWNGDKNPSNRVIKNVWLTIDPIREYVSVSKRSYRVLQLTPIQTWRIRKVKRWLGRRFCCCWLSWDFVSLPNISEYFCGMVLEIHGNSVGRRQKWMQGINLGNERRGEGNGEYFAA